MTKYIKCGGGGLPPQVLSDMEAVLNKKFGTSTTYPSNTWPDLIRTMMPLPEKSASGSIAHFTDGADTVPLKSAKFYITPTQASGTPTPSNPLPISGHTGLTITRTGKNLANIKPYTDWEIIGNAYSLQRNLFAPARVVMSLVDNDPAIDMTGVSFGFVAGDYYSGSLNTNQYKWIINNGVVATVKTNVPASGDNSIYLNSLIAYPRNEATYNKIFARYKIQIEYGTTATSYEPYTATTYPVSWTEEGTIYGGYYKDGELWNTHFKFSGSDVTSVGRSGASGGLTTFSITLANNNLPSAVANTCISNQFSRDIASGNEGRMTQSATVIYFVVSTSRLESDTPAGGLAWLQNNNVDFCYELATPVKVADLEEVGITSLLGVNNIWCDTGDCEVEYRADIELSLNE